MMDSVDARAHVFLISANPNNKVAKKWNFWRHVLMWGWDTFCTKPPNSACGTWGILPAPQLLLLADLSFSSFLQPDYVESCQTSQPGSHEAIQELKIHKFVRRMMMFEQFIYKPVILGQEKNLFVIINPCYAEFKGSPRCSVTVHIRALLIFVPISAASHFRILYLFSLQNVKNVRLSNI